MTRKGRSFLCVFELAALAACVFATTALGVGPSNDNFSNGQTLTGTTGNIAGNDTARHASRASR